MSELAIADQLIIQSPRHARESDAAAKTTAAELEGAISLPLLLEASSHPQTPSTFIYSYITRRLALISGGYGSH